MALYEQIVDAYLEEASAKALTALQESVILDRCYQTLEAIGIVLNDETLQDEDCFSKIEAIVSIYESLGGSTQRHNFG